MLFSIPGEPGRCSTHCVCSATHAQSASIKKKKSAFEVRFDPTRVLPPTTRARVAKGMGSKPVVTSRAGSGPVIDAKCEGVIYWAIIIGGVKDRSIT